MAKSTTFLRSLALLLTILLIGTAAEAQFSISLPLPPPQPSPQTLGKLDPLLQPRLSNITGRSKVIVRAVNVSSIGPVRTLVQQLGGILGRQLPLIEATVADVPNLSLLLLANNPLVQRVALDRLIAGTTERTGATVGATDVRQAFGYDGSGIGVAVIDSGVTGVARRSRAGIRRRLNVSTSSSISSTGARRRTTTTATARHVAGIIAGNGFDSNGARSGIAPAARLVVLKVLDAGRPRPHQRRDCRVRLRRREQRRLQYPRSSTCRLPPECSSRTTPISLTLAARRAVDRRHRGRGGRRQRGQRIRRAGRSTAASRRRAMRRGC